MPHSRIEAVPLVTLPLPLLDGPVLDLQDTQLPLINYWLSMSWIDTLIITDKVKKVNNSNILTHLWHRGIAGPLNVLAGKFLAK